MVTYSCSIQYQLVVLKLFWFWWLFQFVFCRSKQSARETLSVFWFLFPRCFPLFYFYFLEQKFSSGQFVRTVTLLLLLLSFFFLHFPTWGKDKKRRITKAKKMKAHKKWLFSMDRVPCCFERPVWVHTHTNMHTDTHVPCRTSYLTTRISARRMVMGPPPLLLLFYCYVLFFFSRVLIALTRPERGKREKEKEFFFLLSSLIPSSSLPPPDHMQPLLACVLSDELVFIP